VDEPLREFLDALLVRRRRAPERIERRDAEADVARAARNLREGRDLVLPRLDDGGDGLAREREESAT
jgi:hypothetical protein